MQLIIALVKSSWRTSEGGANVHVTSQFSLNAIYWEKECLPKQLACLALVEVHIKTYDIALYQTLNRIHEFKYREFVSSQSIFTRTFCNWTFSFINVQPSNMYGEQLRVPQAADARTTTVRS